MTGVNSEMILPYLVIFSPYGLASFNFGRKQSLCGSWNEETVASWCRGLGEHGDCLGIGTKEGMGEGWKGPLGLV